MITNFDLNAKCYMDFYANNTRILVFDPGKRFGIYTVKDGKKLIMVLKSYLRKEAGQNN